MEKKRNGRGRWWKNNNGYKGRGNDGSWIFFSFLEYPSLGMFLLLLLLVISLSSLLLVSLLLLASLSLLLLLFVVVSSLSLVKSLSFSRDHSSNLLAEWVISQFLTLFHYDTHTHTHTHTHTTKRKESKTVDRIFANTIGIVVGRKREGFASLQRSRTFTNSLLANHYYLEPSMGRKVW